MILITGGTGFVGQALIRHLTAMGYPVRILIRPAARSPNLPKGIPMEVAVSSLDDERGLRAAMVGVHTVYHLVSGERQGPRANLVDIDIQGTRAVVNAAADARVRRIFYLSHLGADRASAYPVLKAKAIAEEHIRRSGIDYTIFRSAIVYGPNDGFTTGMARIMHSLPFIFLMPGDGKTLIQPLWVEDLVACLGWANEDGATRNQTIEVGGPEYLSFDQAAGEVMSTIHIERKLVPMRPPYLRALTVLVEHIIPSLPVSVYWLDYLATNRTCPIENLPRLFNLMPARFSQRLAYLKGKSWRFSLARALLRRTAS